MAGKRSAGIVMYRWCRGVLEVFLVHPGGPFWAKKDLGAWSIPKGEFDADEDPLAAAQREFEEETGYRPSGSFQPLGPIKQKGGKIVYAWAVQGDLDAAAIKSNTFSLAWPPGSGRRQEFAEVDRAAWLTITTAQEKILPAQAALLEQLQELMQTHGA